MSDLISRSELLKEIETWGGCVEALQEYISNMPTAFDTERVVEQLEGLSNAEADYYYAMNNDVIDREDAIDIVKKGGVEWEKLK